MSTTCLENDSSLMEQASPFGRRLLTLLQQPKIEPQDMLAIMHDFPEETSR